MPRGNYSSPLVPGLPNARRCAPGLLSAMAALYDDAHALTHEQAVAEYDRIAVEDCARRSAQQSLPLRGGE